jgi:hypothetical protein
MRWPVICIVGGEGKVESECYMLLTEGLYAVGGVTDDPIDACPARPLTQEGRILAVLRKPGGALPRVSATWLVRYYEHLSASLEFPFEACCPEECGSVRPWTAAVWVIGLMPPSTLAQVDDTGLVCTALHNGEAIKVPLIDLEIVGEYANAQLIEDYWYWFWNWRFDPGI